MANSIKMILDVEMPVTVRLGQTKMKVRQLLALKKGKVVTLNKMAGEAVDLYVDKKLLAKGEITVIDDRFAVRVGNLYGDKEKFKHL